MFAAGKDTYVPPLLLSAFTTIFSGQVSEHVCAVLTKLKIRSKVVSGRIKKVFI
jgi:hypothetical protein